MLKTTKVFWWFFALLNVFKLDVEKICYNKNEFLLKKIVKNFAKNLLKSGVKPKILTNLI